MNLLKRWWWQRARRRLRGLYREGGHYASRPFMLQEVDELPRRAERKAFMRGYHARLTNMPRRPCLEDPSYYL